MNKYRIDYPIKILSYNIYFKAMLGLDDLFLPKELAQKNVKNIIKTGDYDIIGLQEVECINKIFDISVLSKYNYVLGKSGKETIATFFKKRYHLIKEKTSEFHEGRPIQLLLLEDNGNKILLVNLHAPHDYNNFRNYNGKESKSNYNYSLELINILNYEINKFIKQDISRIILLGDFNEFSQNNTKEFNINVNDTTYELKTDNDIIRSCCYPNFLKEGDLIFDSNNSLKLSIVSTIHPASDHYPVMTII